MTVTSETKTQQEKIISTLIKDTFTDPSPKLWFDWDRFGPLLQIEINYRRRWWVIGLANVEETAASIREIQNYLKQEHKTRLPHDDRPVVQTILAERAGTHGSFVENAFICHGIRGLLRNRPGWNKLSDPQKLALDEIALKIARLMSPVEGSGPQPAQNVEHWRDIQGYAKLGEDACLKAS